MFDFINPLLENPILLGVGLIIGFIFLIKGADWLVDGASGLAKRWGVSNLVIGLTIVAFGTSMPELVVNMVAAFDHHTEIAITNILGSNTINVFVILGCSAIIFPVASQASCRHFDIPWSLLAGLLVLFFASYTQPSQWIWGEWGHLHTQGDFITGIGGLFFLCCFVVFLWHSTRNAKNNQAEEETDTAVQMSIGKAILFILIGLAGLIIGGELIVKSAVKIAVDLGVSDAVIGLTIVALGTSLPELATSCIAAYKHNSDLALGNVIGSNIFNVFMILGISAVITPLKAYDGLWLDALMVILGSALVWIFVSEKEHLIKRRHGIYLLLIYAVYLTYRLVAL
ncbi:MAG: calcium/sodium antiporter [Paludibacteraceae bacterium]|nr:calcium/sodium antiporter [Paludibacteraceae bacterium]